MNDQVFKSGESLDAEALLRHIHDNHLETEGLTVDGDGNCRVERDGLQPSRKSHSYTCAELEKMATEAGLVWRQDYCQRAMPWWASDERVDRHGDIVLQNWDFKQFMNNPVMLYSHNWDSVPIGSVIKWEVMKRRTEDYEGRSLQLLPVFATKDEYDYADTIYRLAKARIIRTGSVGFFTRNVINVADMDERKALGLGPQGMVFDDNLLVEWTVAPIPANTGAVQVIGKAAKSGLVNPQDLNVLRELRRAHAERTKDANWQSLDSDLVAMWKSVFPEFETETDRSIEKSFVDFGKALKGYDYEDEDDDDKKDEDRYGSYHNDDDDKKDDDKRSYHDDEDEDKKDPMRKMVVPFAAVPMMSDENASWDGDAARQRMRAWAEKDDGELDYEKYARGFAYIEPDMMEQLGGYKLPHHDVVDGELRTHRRGVIAAMAALNGARTAMDLTDDERSEIYDHLSKHYAQFEMDPPDLLTKKEIENELIAEELAILLGGHLDEEDEDKEEKGGHLPEEEEEEEEKGGHLPEEEEDEEEKGGHLPEEEEEEDEKEEMKDAHNVGFAVVGTSNDGKTEGMYGYYYPLYMTKEEADSIDEQMGGEGTRHMHTFDEYPGMVFYMPDSSMNHAVDSLPLGIPLMPPPASPQDSMEDEEQKESGVVIKADVSVGDYVMWTARKGKYRGQVARIQREGDAGVGESRQEATSDNPIAHVTVLANLGDDKFMITDREFPVNFSRLTKIGKPDIINESIDKQSQAVKDTLKKKASEHNEKHGDDSRKKTTATVLYEVFKRGVGAYRNNPGSVRPTVTSEEQWAYARVNGFLYALRNLKFKNKPYDTDLLPEAHPLSSKSFELADVEDAQLRDVDLSVPAYMRENARRGLEYHEQGLSGDGLRPQTVREARAMAKGDITEDKVMRMRAWFIRHRSDLEPAKNSNPDNDDFPGPGAVAWYLWGGNPVSNEMQAYNWADKKMQQIDAESKDASRALIYEELLRQLSKLNAKIEKQSETFASEIKSIKATVKNISTPTDNNPKDYVESGNISEALIKALEMTDRVTGK